MKSDKRIGFRGFGDMGKAVCDGLIKAGAVDPANVCACAGRWDRLLEAAGERGVRPCRTAAEVVEGSDIIVVAVKPYLVAQVLTPVKDDLAGKMIVSVAFGRDLAFYQTFLPAETNLIHMIPNTPVSCCKGILLCDETNSLTGEQMETFRQIFGTLGAIEFVETDKMTVAGEVASCGPAFAAMFIEALGDAGVKYGLKRETAYRLASRMIEGTGALQAETGRHPGDLKDEVCSPGGATIRGVAALEEAGFRNALIKALDAIQNK